MKKKEDEMDTCKKMKKTPVIIYPLKEDATKRQKRTVNMTMYIPRIISTDMDKDDRLLLQILYVI